MNNIITVTTENGKKVKVEVIDIFQVAGYENKDYILDNFYDKEKAS